MRDHPYRNLHDQELFLLFRQGSNEAFTEIYQRYHGGLYLHALKMLQDRDEAQDAIQEVFTKIWHRKERLELTTSLSSYLYTAVRNRILDIFSHQKRVEQYQLSLQEYLDKGEFITDNIIRENELAALIENEISKLPPKMQEVFLLSRNTDLSYAQIAQELSISENTVRKHITKALAKLKDKLGDFLIAFFIPLATVLWSLI